MRRRLRFPHFLFVLSLGATVALLGAGTLALNRIRDEFPDVGGLKTRFPVIQYRGPKKPFEVAWSKVRPDSWATLSEVSRSAVGAVIVSEDWAFYSHPGYDLAQIREAIQEDLEEGRFARGASTITQQVAKNVFLERDKTLWRKVREFVLARELEARVGKRRILETYLNIAEWGEGVFGIRAASRHYFGKSPSDLSPKEGAFLAMLLPSPKKYSVSFRKREMTAYASHTVRSILKKMVQAGYLDEDRLEPEQSRPLSFEERGVVLPEEGLTESAEGPQTEDSGV